MGPTIITMAAVTPTLAASVMAAFRVQVTVWNIQHLLQ